MKRKELLVAMSLLFAACGQKSVETTPGEDRIDLSTDSGPVEQKIKSISLVNLDTDVSWSFINQSMMTKSTDRYAFVHRHGKRLLMYDKSGKKVVDRSIEGRGPGELYGVENVFAVDDKVYCFDDAEGNLIAYDSNGKYVSKWTFVDYPDFLYRVGDSFVALSLFQDYYVSVYDKDLNKTDSYLKLDEFFKYNSASFGLTPASYVYKDSLRFIMAHDYTIYSLSNGSFTPRFEFVAVNPIPSSVYSKYEGEYRNALDFAVELTKEGYEYGFSSLAETGRYLMFEYFSRGTKKCLFDKQEKILYRSFPPNNFLSEENPQAASSSDVWQNIMYYLIPSYSDGESVYCRISKGFYEVLKSNVGILDDRLKSLYQEITRYMTRNTLSDGDLLILRVEFE